MSRLYQKYRHRKTGKVYQLVDEINNIMFLSDGSESLMCVSHKTFNSSFIEC